MMHSKLGSINQYNGHFILMILWQSWSLSVIKTTGATGVYVKIAQNVSTNMLIVDCWNTILGITVRSVLKWANVEWTLSVCQVCNFIFFLLKMSTFLKFQDYIWTHHEKYIQISTNMPGNGTVVPIIGFKFWEF